MPSTKWVSIQDSWTILRWWCKACNHVPHHSLFQLYCVQFWYKLLLQLLMLTLKVTFYRLPLSLLVHTVYAQLLIQLKEVVTKISSCWVNITSRQRIKQLQVSFGSILFLLVFISFSPIFFWEHSGAMFIVAGGNPQPLPLNDSPVSNKLFQYLFKTKEIVSFSHHSVLPIPSIALQSSR